jgi:murein DD-endopeptidase MepM/ murein hydrolase activator NlpD
MMSASKRAMMALVTGLGCATVAGEARAQFTYRPAGELVSGSGRGRVDSTVYAPGIRFPIENAPAYLNSQVWGVGGSSGPAGGQCDARNFSYPWRDNYCETRSWDMPMCPAGVGHQGQDMRASDCRNSVHNVVAVADGTITNIGSYSVYLTTADGTRYDYLHMSNVAVTVGQSVRRGQVVGRVSNQFGGTPTTIHLHFNIRRAVSGFGSVYAPTYMSLVRAYENLTGGGMMMGTRFAAQFVMQSFPLASTTLNLPAGAEQRGYFEFRNTGTDTWRPGEVFMGTTQPRDRISPARGSDWVRGSRAATIDRVVAPGATGRFNFSVRAPTTVGQEYSEFFGIVREGVAWFSDTGQGGPADNVLQVRVRASSVAPPMDSGVGPVDSGVVVDSGVIVDTGVVEDTGVSFPEDDAAAFDPDAMEPGEEEFDDAGMLVRRDARTGGSGNPGAGGVPMGGCGCVVAAGPEAGFGRGFGRGPSALFALGLGALAVAKRRARRRGSV